MDARMDDGGWRMDGGTEGRMEGWRDGWMDGWRDGSVCPSVLHLQRFQASHALPLISGMLPIGVPTT